MTFFILSIVAGVLTILAPCILPLLPIVIGAAGTGVERKAKPYIIIASLSVSVVVFTLLLKASTLLIEIPPSFWTWFSGGVIVLLGVMTLFPQLWNRLPWMHTIHTGSNKVVGTGHTKNSVYGDIVVGAALGPVFSTCSPTYLFILATVLPASFGVGLVYLFGFVFGLAVALAAVAFLGQKIIGRISLNYARAELLKKVFGVLFIIVGVAIISGIDKKIETWLLERGVGGTVLFEERLIEEATQDGGVLGTQEPSSNGERGSVENATVPDVTSGSVDVPNFLARAFPETDFSQATSKIEDVLSGGPGKDGIPAIDEPTFVPLSAFSRPDGVQVIVLAHEDTHKVYPYNILTWHEIVNDTANGMPVAVTFCPLCGSAIVYDRTLPDSAVTTFGVSGALLESNLVMYDRATETLWQQSTGHALAGKWFGAELTLVQFQLMTLGEVRAQYPEALVLSEDTGYVRDYGRNPYAGYEENEQYIFEPSNLDRRYPGKDIFVAFRVNDSPVAAPWLSLESGEQYETRVGEEVVTLTKNGSELSITNSSGERIPFYFEMWFSWAVHHGEEGVVYDPRKA